MRKTVEGYMRRISALVLGLAIFSFGSYLSIQANVGLAPWDTFSMGVSALLRIPFGGAAVLVSLLILAITILLRESIGIGTILNVILYGTFVGMYQSLGWIPQLEDVRSGVCMLLIGQLIMAWGAYSYIRVGLGCGPRDMLMVGMARRMTRLPVGIVRILLEGSVVAIGGLLGGKIGIGTLIAAFAIGAFLQLIFKLTGFDCRELHHETCLETFNKLSGRTSQE